MICKIAFQGELGAYSHQAALQWMPQAQVLPCLTFAQAMEAVYTGQVDYAALPIENSSWGRVADIHKLLPQSALYIVAEILFSVEHALLVLPGTDLRQIKSVYSHPQALGQCRNFIEKNQYQAVPYYDTAGAAAYIAEKNNPEHAAIAGCLAAEIYGLAASVNAIQDDTDNKTRFLVMAAQPLETDISPFEDGWITSMIFNTRDIPAALYKALGGFASNSVNLLKLESYQSHNHFFSSQFYIEIAGHPKMSAVENAIEELEFFCKNLRVLGSYRMVCREGGVSS